MSRPFLERQDDGYHWYAIDDDGQIIYSSPDMSREVRERFFRLDALDPRDEIDEERGADSCFANGLNEERQRLNLIRWRIQRGRQTADDIAHLANQLRHGESGFPIPYLLTLLGDSQAFECEAIVASFLDVWQDYFDATTALDVLAGWGLILRYEDRVVEFMQGIERDANHDLQAWTCAKVSWWLSGESRGGSAPPETPREVKVRLLRAFVAVAEGLDAAAPRRFGIVANLATAVGYDIRQASQIPPDRVFEQAHVVLRELARD